MAIFKSEWTSRTVLFIALTVGILLAKFGYKWLSGFGGDVNSRYF